MANPVHLAKLSEGPDEWRAWRSENLTVAVDLSGANLTGLDLKRVDLSRADLRNATISGANLFTANLSQSILIGANLSGADLRGADLTLANLATANLNWSDLSAAELHMANLFATQLNGAKLCGAELGLVNFQFAHLDQADFEGANFHWTIFGGNDLRRATGLDRCRHSGPSTIGIDTIVASRGNIPESFLRGCGLPDNFIEQLPSLLNQPTNFYSCFISFSAKDQNFANRLYADLQNKGVRCWFAPHDVAGGKKLHEQIDEAIRVYDRLLLVLSDHSIKSPWVETEISKARRREQRESRRMLFPVGLVNFETLRDWECFDADTGKDSAREIREYFIPDFSNWKEHDQYQAAFQRLLRDLTTKGELKTTA